MCRREVNGMASCATAPPAWEPSWSTRLVQSIGHGKNARVHYTSKLRDYSVVAPRRDQKTLEPVDLIVGARRGANSRVAKGHGRR